MATAVAHVNTDQIGHRGFNSLAIVICPIRRSANDSAVSCRMTQKEA